MSNAATAGKVGIVFLHGSGSNGRDLRSFLSVVAMKEFNFQSFTEVCESHRWYLSTPTAPMRSYTADGGEERNVWFDRSVEWHDRGFDDEFEDVDGADESVRQVLSAVKNLCDQHREIQYVFIGGFSMGGATSLHTLRNFFNTNALETNRNMPILRKIKGVFVFSSFLVQSSVVFGAFKTANFELARSVLPLPQVFMGHGDCDEMVPLEWASATAASFMQLGVDIQLNRYKGVEHEFTMQGLQELIDWMRFVIDADITAEAAGASDAKVDRLARDLKSSGIDSDGEDENGGEIEVDGAPDALVRAAEQGDKHYYAQEQQLMQSQAASDAEEKRSRAAETRRAGGAVDAKADSKPPSGRIQASSSVSSVAAPLGGGASAQESPIPYEIEYLSATRSAYANQVRIVFTVPRTTASSIDM